jgi:arginine exporter protein ArgO
MVYFVIAVIGLFFWVDGMIRQNNFTAVFGFVCLIVFGLLFVDELLDSNGTSPPPAETAQEA